MKETRYLKLLFFAPAPLPHSIALEEALEARGHRVSYWYLYSKRDYYPWQKANKKNTKLIDKNPLSIFKVLRDAYDCDLAVIVGWHSIYQVVVAAYCFLLRKKVVFWLDIPESPKPGLKRKVKAVLLKLADGYFLSGWSGRDIWQGSYNLPEERCFDFPYLEHRFERSTVLTCHSEMRQRTMDGRPMVVLVANRFLKRKGYDVLSEALLRLPEYIFAQLEFEILGDGPELDRFESKLSDCENVNFRGWVEYGDYIVALMNSDVYLHASLHEPFGIPPIDAMAVAKVVVSSNKVYSALDRIVTGQNGFLYEAGDPEKLANILTWLVEHRSKLPDIGLAAYETAKAYGVEFNEKAIYRAAREG